MQTENISVTMNRPTLDNLPAYELPDGYRLRWYQPGDEVAWVAIHVDADPYHHFDVELFWREFDPNVTLLAARQAYLCPLLADGTEGAPIGTATAWFGVEEARRTEGLIHWVAIHPSAQGKGLAKPLLAAVCHRLQTLGHQSVYLNTSTARIPAIGLYLNFGFVPAPRGDQTTMLRAWQQVRNQLSHPALDEFLAKVQT